MWLRMWVGHLLRRGWRATLFLAVLAGLAGGISMAAVRIGRKASTSFDRFLAFSAPSDLTVSFCPADIAAIDEASFRRCLTYDSTDEVAVAGSSAEGRIGRPGCVLRDDCVVTHGTRAHAAGRRCAHVRRRYAADGRVAGRRRRSAPGPGGR